MSPDPGSEKYPPDPFTDAADEPHLAEEPLVEPSAVGVTARFCHRCGAAWDAQADQCPACAAMAADPAAEVKPVKGGVRLVALALVLYFIILGSILGFAFTARSQAVAMLTSDIFMTIIVLIWGVGFWQYVGPLLSTLSKPVNYLMAVALAGVTFGAAAVAVSVLSLLPGIPILELTRPFLAEGYGWGIIVLSTCIQPAIIEEIAFRGVIFSAMEQVLSARDAVIISALLFMVIHLSILSYPHLLLIGLALGWLRMRTGSLYPGMLLHFTHNFLVLMTDPR